MSANGDEDVTQPSIFALSFANIAAFLLEKPH